MEWIKKMAKKTIFLLAFLILAQIAFAQQSQLELSWTPENQLFVSNLYDDDDTIGLLEVFAIVDDPASPQTESPVSTRFVFENVISGQVLPVNVFDLPKSGGTAITAAPGIYPKTGALHFDAKTPLKGNLQNPSIGQGNNSPGGTSTAPAPPITFYYNFLDTDGIITNSKFFIYLNEPFRPPKDVDNTVYVASPLTSKSLNQRKGTASEDYFIDIEVAGNNIESTVFNYFLSGSLDEQQVMLEPATPENSFKATIGPFEGKVVLDSKITVLSQSKTYSYLFEKKSFDFVSKEPDGSCRAAGLSEKIFRQDSTTANFAAGIVSKTQALNLPFIKIVEDAGAQVSPGQKALKVAYITHATQIDSVEFFIEPPSGEITRHSFEDVYLGQEIILENVPENSKIFYNFINEAQQGTARNMNFLLPVMLADSLDLPFFTSDLRGEIFEEASLEVIPSSDCSSFKVRAKARTNGTESNVYLKYGFDNTNLGNFIQLHAGEQQAGLAGQKEQTITLEGGEYVEELGPFNSDTDFYANFYAENSEGQIDRITGLSQWIGLQEGASIGHEICGNFVDDDNDGQVDENCILLPDLFFLGEEIPSFFVENQETAIPVTIKNAGVTSATSFDVSLYINDSLADSVTVDSLSQGEEKKIELGFFASSDNTGENTVKILIDPANEVSELNELNNELTAKSFIGKMGFKVTLNFNDSSFLGDERKIRALDSFGEPVRSALVKVNLPSGKTLDLSTDSEGFTGFVLEEIGAHLVKAEKQGFEAFEGAFRVPKIVIPEIKQAYSTGEFLSLKVQTEEGEKIQDFTAVITTPSNETKTLQFEEQLQLSSPGKYGILVSRNNVKIYEGEISVSGGIEYFFAGGSVQNQLFGQIIEDTPLFIFLLLFSFVAAWFFYIKQKTISPFTAVSTRQKRAETFLRFLISTILFFLPFQAAKLGFGAGVLMAALEIIIVFLLEILAKTKEEKKPFGFN